MPTHGTNLTVYVACTELDYEMEETTARHNY
jgi:hypothetical protein